MPAIEDNSPILAPMAALLLWTMVMWIWLFATRIPALNRSKVDLKTFVGGKGTDLDGVLPEKVQWKAHNHNHLHEQPVLFYAACLLLALIGMGQGTALWLAWSYVALRIAHSLVQASWNKVSVRFTLYVLASFCLFALIIMAALALF